MTKGRRMTKKNSKGAQFVVPTPEEEKKDRQEYMDYQTREGIKNIYDYQGNWLSLKQIEARIEFRLQQLGRNWDGEEVSEPRILEKFNGADKTQAMLESELNSDIFGYKQIVGEIEHSKKYFKKELGFEDETITKIARGDFDIEAWKDERLSNSDKPKDKDNYFG